VRLNPSTRLASLTVSRRPIATRSSDLSELIRDDLNRHLNEWYSSHGGRSTAASAPTSSRFWTVPPV
jgi:hypothetical protein